jgi:hypothetical protein
MRWKGDGVDGDKSSLSSGFLKKALSNEAPSDPIRNYLLPTAFAIIFTLKPTIWHWTNRRSFSNEVNINS